MTANPNMWAFAVSSSVSMVVMAVLWEVLGAMPSPVLMQQTATLTEDLRNGMRDRLWMNVWLREYAYECFSGLWDIVCCNCWGMCRSYISFDLKCGLCFCVEVRWVCWREWVRKDRRERWNHTFFSCETPTTNGCFWNSSSPLVPYLTLPIRGRLVQHKHTILSNISVHFQKKQNSWAPALLFLFISPYVSFYFLNLAPLWLEFEVGQSSWRPLWIMSNPRGGEKAWKKRASEERNMSVREGRKWWLKNVQIALNPHRPIDSQPRPFSQTSSSLHVDGETAHDCCVGSAAGSCYCLWAWLSLCISNVHLKAQWKQIGWLCCGQRNVCVCVCLDDRLYGERERRGEEGMGILEEGRLCWPCPVARCRGWKVKERWRKRESQRCGAYCLL